ncbi:DUF91 domain-containing protein, partial [archaeon]|nr:DUF91 domain-containing protein [archaeon]
YSDELKGVSRIFVGKVLSIYFPNYFIEIFGHQEFFLEKLYVDYKPQDYGVKLYLKNNLLLLNFKKKYFGDLNNNEFTYLLYKTFEKKKADLESKKEEGSEEYKFNALEVDHYQSLIHRNFKHLFKDEYSYYDEEYQNENSGHFNTLEVGILDFLVKDKENNLVVIELKRDSTDKTLGQILRYMGWVKANLCKKDQKIKGIIIAETKDNRLGYALKIIDNVEFKKMKLNVEITDDDN